MFPGRPQPDRAVDILITCEHGGNRIPRNYAPLFRHHRALLKTHEGYDRGALALAKTLARLTAADLVYAVTSRLLIELNRSPGHPKFFSAATANAPREIQQEIARRYYRPYRRRVEQRAASATDVNRQLIHVSAHTFTPVLNGKTREADIGLLYDPKRTSEVDFCATWAHALAIELPNARVRRNYPYKGVSDGLTTFLRSRFGADDYIGVELEVNQKHVSDGRAWRNYRSAIGRALKSAVESAESSRRGVIGSAKHRSA